jgi:hypothetical protein
VTKLILVGCVRSSPLFDDAMAWTAEEAGFVSPAGEYFFLFSEVS